MTDERSKCFVGVIIVTLHDDGTRRYLVVPSIWGKRPGTRPKIKFPGGMHKVTDENFEATARREVRSETNLRIKKSVTPRLLTRFKFDDQWKFFYIVNRKECRGTLRRHTIEDGDSILSKPEWMTLEELEAHLTHTHKLVLIDLKKVV